MAGSSKGKVDGLISDPSRIPDAIRNGRDAICHLLNELKNRADPEAASAMKETYSALMDFILDGQRGHKSHASNHKSKEEKRNAVDMLLLDLDSLPTTLLVSMMIRCNEEIQNGQDQLDPCLMALVGMLVSVLGSRDVVVEGGEQKSGTEYRDRIIRVLCNANWLPRNLVLLCNLLRDVSSLSQSEWDYATDTIVMKLDHIEPDEMPATVFQLLLISKGLNGSKILSALVEYYNKRLIFSEGDVEEDHDDGVGEDNSSQLDSADLISSGPQSGSIQQSASTVLFHVCQALSQGHPIHKDLLRLLRAGAQSPHLVLSPFVLFLGLAMASVKKFRQSVGDAIRAIFVKQIDIKLRCRHDAWFEHRSHYVAVATLTKHLIRQSTKFGGWDHIAQGVLDLAMALLATSSNAVARDSQRLRQAWTVGTTIILSVVKSSPSSVEVLVKLLNERILASGKVAATTIQYTNCLSRIISQRRSVLMENPNIIWGVLDDIASLEIATAREVLCAVMPLVRIVRSVRDTTILVLRKALFARSSKCKQVGLEGVMQLLMTFKIPTSMSGTQMNLSQTSSTSLLSQSSEEIRRGKAVISQDVICSDLIGVLKRALTQHVAVRVAMYQGLGNVSGMNPELTMSFLDILHQHGISQKWITMAEDEASNLVGETRRAAVWNLDSLIVEHAAEVEITDACGWFLHCVVQVLSRARQVYPNAENDLSEHQSYYRLSALLSDTTRHHSNADISIDFDLIKDAEYSHFSTEGEANLAKVEHLKNVYESLIEHCVLTGGAEGDEDSSSAINMLFSRYKELCQLLKCKPATKSGRGKKKTDDTIAALKKNIISCSFSVPENTFSLRCLSDILLGLLVDRVPSRQRGFAEMRKSRGLVEHFLLSLLSKLTVLSSGQSCAASSSVRHLMKIGLTLSKALLNDDEADPAFVGITAECLLLNIEVIVRHFPGHLVKFLETIGSGHEEPPTIAASLLKIFNLIATRIAAVNDNSGEVGQDGVMNKNRALAGLLRLVNLVGSILAEHGIKTRHVKDVLKKIYDWTKAFGRGFVLPEAEEDTESHGNKSVLKAFLDLLFSSTRRLKSEPDISTVIARQIHNVLGNLNETQLQMQEVNLPYVTVASSESVFQSLSSYFDSVFESIDLTVAKCRQMVATSSTGLINGDIHYEYLERVECDVVRLLANLVNGIGELAQSGFRFGLLLDKLVRLLTRYMTLIDCVAKYFLLRCKTYKNAVKISGFEMLVEKTRVLTSHIYDMITHLEAKEKAMDFKTCNSAHRLAVKEQKIIPNLVMKVEQFENSLLKLNKKFNIEVTVKPSTSRDFRYKPEMSNYDCEEEDEVDENISQNQSSPIHLQEDEEKSDEEDDPTSPDPSGHHIGESTALESNSQSSPSLVFGSRTSLKRAGSPQCPPRSPTHQRISPSSLNSLEPEKISSPSASRKKTPSPVREPPPKKSKQKALGMRRR